ncbi:MAG: type II secretion system F family protein [Candidatus Bathyarchaeia archaeon]|jgi:flagellar protein FlaJ
MNPPLSYRLFGWLFKHRPFSSLSVSIEKALAKARIQTAGDAYLSEALTQSILAGFMFLVFNLIIQLFGLTAHLNSLLVGPTFMITYIFPFLPLIGFLLTAIYYYVKPYYANYARRQDIDQNIHHASAFLYAMTKSGLQPVEALEKLAEQKNIYGLISEEFGMAVRRVKYFGESLNTALKYVANTTSSKNLKEFIYSFILATEQSYSVGAYFKLKFEEYFEKEKRGRETLINNLNLIGEIVIVLVALTPTLVLAVGLSLGVMNPSMISISNLYLIFVLPLSAILVLFYVRAVLPSPKLISVTKTVFPMPLVENIPVSETPQSKLSGKTLERTDKRLLFKKALKKPIQIFFLYSWFYFIIGAAILASVLVGLYFFGLDYQQLFVCSFLGSCSIVLIFHEVKSRYVLAVERRVPTFLRGLAETVEREGSIIRAINLVLQSKLGLLGREMKDIGTTNLGYSLKRAMTMIEYRTSSVVLKRVLSLLVIASESTKNMKDILVMAAEDADSYIRLRRERTLNLVGYIISSYVCFGVFLYVYYTFKTSFIPSLSGVAAFSSGIAFAPVMVEAYYVALFLALMLGLLVGALAEGSVLSGLKHSVVMIIIAIIVMGWKP